MIVAPALAALVARHAALLLVDGIPTAPAAAVVAWLDGIGADQLALATGQPLARLGDAPARIQRAPRKGQLGSQRAAIARCTGVAMDELAHVRIGARALAPRLSVQAAWQLAVTDAAADRADRRIASSPRIGADARCARVGRAARVIRSAHETGARHRG